MIYVNLICISFLLLILLISRNYKKEEIKKLDNKKYPLKELYPLGLFIIDIFISRIPHGYGYSVSYKVDEALEALHIGEKPESLKRIYHCKKIIFVMIIFFLTNVFCLISFVINNNDNELIDGKYLKRADYGKGNSSKNLHVEVGNGRGIILEEEMEIEIKERQITEEETGLLLEEGITYIDSVILLNNQDTDTIKSDLSFPNSIPSKGIKITWETEDKSIIDTKGHVYNQKLKEPKLIWVKATLKLKGREVLYTRYFKVIPKEYTQKELIQKQLLEEIEVNNNDTLTQDKLRLPSKVGEENVVWSIENKNHSSVLFILGLMAAGLIYYFMDKELWEKVNKKNQEMLLDYPDIINKFTLLVGAGMSLSNAWSKIAVDYKKEGKYKYAYEEMNITVRELSVGVSEITAYERFGRRVKLLPYLRFSSLLARNVKKGSKDLLDKLEIESLEAFEERKELAKRLGEEAGTKLLMPMMIMLILVLAIILVPAFLSFQF